MKKCIYLLSILFIMIGFTGCENQHNLIIPTDNYIVDTPIPKPKTRLEIQPEYKAELENGYTFI